MRGFEAADLFRTDTQGGVIVSGEEKRGGGLGPLGPFRAAKGWRVYAVETPSVWALYG